MNPVTPLDAFWQARPGWRRRWRPVVALAILVGILIGGVSYLSSPRVQRDFVLAKLSPLVDQLSIEFLHITPWSLRLEGVDVSYRGGNFHVGHAEFGFNPLALVERTINIRYLHLRHTDIDLRALQSTPTTAPFGGVLPSLNHGYSIVLRGVDLAASVRFAGEQDVAVRVRGGGIKPHVTGTLGLDLTYVRGPDRIEAVGDVSLSQLSQGRFRAVRAALDSRVVLAALPVPLENLHIDIAVTPPPGLQGNTFRTSRPSPGDSAPRQLANPEAVAFAASLAAPSEDSPGINFTFDGLYRPDDGVLSAGYRVLSKLSTVQPMLSPDPLPEVAGETRGAFQFNTVALTGVLTLETQQQVTLLERVLGEHADTPADITVTARSQGKFEQSTFTLDQFELDAGVTAAAPNLTLSLAEPLTVTFADPLQLLARPRRLAQLALNAIPLAWFNGLVPEYRAKGEFNGRYTVGVDAEARFKLDALAPTNVTLGDLRQGDVTVASDLLLTVDPSASWSQDFIRFALNDLNIKAGQADLVTLDLKLAGKLGETPPRMWRYRVRGGVDFDSLRVVPALATRVATYPLPPGLKLNFKGLVAQRDQAVSIEKLDATLASPIRPDLIHVSGLQAFHFHLGAGVPKLNNPAGPLAEVALRGLDLEWFNPFLPAQELAGSLVAADLVLSAPSKKSLQVEAKRALRIDGFSLRLAGQSQLNNLTLSSAPTVTIADGEYRVRLQDLDVRSGPRSLITGFGDLDARGFGGAQSEVTTRGQWDLDLGGLALQPVIAAMLPQAPPALPLSGKIEFDLKQTAELITVNAAHAQLLIGERGRVDLKTEPGLELRTALKPGENLARHVIGAAAVDIQDLASASLAKFVPLGNIAFAEINSNLRVKSDGQVLRLASLAPLAIEDFRISDGTKPLLQPFSISASGKVTVAEQEIRANLEEIAVRFKDHESTPAVAGAIKVYATPGRAVPISKLETQLIADLPQLLAQPAGMPGHQLTSGALSLAVNVDADRKIDANILLDKLIATQPLAISKFELPITGEVAADARGFDFTAPLLGRGKSGLTTATVVGHYEPQPDEPRVLNLKINSEVFYLNDILASVAAISSKSSSAAKAAEGAGSKVKLNENPDTKAAWKVIPYAVVIDLNIDKLFYTDYLAFTKVAGKMDLRRRQFELSGLRGFFHDSAIAFDGVTRFVPANSDPYALELTGRVVDFNLNQFFSELVPGEKPRVEGLFGVGIKAFGQFPNFSQLRNRVLFDITMQSRDGLFRPLPPDSGLLLGASDVLGVVGEGLSYVPTGGFGAGAVARLVNYIAEIDYDTIDIHLVRDASRDVKIEQFLVLSPTIALTATGGIAFTPGSDILDSPLELNAHLDMLGRGAAILYSMDLMEDTQNELGYWRGPEFRIWGTAAVPESNFADVVQKAGDGTLKGAITRPISGLIGNLKYRWFNDDSKAKEAALRARRAKGESGAPAPAAEAAAPVVAP